MTILVSVYARTPLLLCLLTSRMLSVSVIQDERGYCIKHRKSKHGIIFDFLVCSERIL